MKKLLATTSFGRNRTLIVLTLETNPVRLSVSKTKKREQIHRLLE